eukprot:8748513-Prorocentrum_lima.AAC.1
MRAALDWGVVSVEGGQVAPAWTWAETLSNLTVAMTRNSEGHSLHLQNPLPVVFHAVAHLHHLP